MTTPTAPGLGPILVDERQGLLTLNSVAMCQRWWCVANVSALWQDPDQRGTDRVVPGVAGVLSYPRRGTETTWSMDIVITGAILYDGTLIPDPANQFKTLEANMAYLEAHVTAPVTTGTGTVAASVVMPSGATRTAQAHVGPLRIQDIGGPLIVAKFDLTIPSGQLT